MRYMGDFLEVDLDDMRPADKIFLCFRERRYFTIAIDTREI